MSKNKEIDNFLNPVGSVDMTLHSRYGNYLHEGSFSEDNPYLEQLRQANYNSKRQDIDALYERAVEWQADRSNLLEQRQFDRAVLLEQREYDSPEQQIARMRKAGINPDLVGSSGGSGSVGSGSSAEMNQSAIADQSAQTKFSNSYDDTALMFQGLNTAVNFVSSLSGLATSVVDGVCKLRMLSPQRSLVEAQTGLIEAQSNEVNTLLSGKEQAQNIGNINSRLQSLASVARLTSAKSTDEELTSFLKGVGIAESDLPDSLSAVKQLHSNPEMLAKYFSDVNNQRKAEAYHDTYTPAVVKELTNIAYDTQKHKMLGEMHIASIQEGVQAILDNPEYKALLAQNTQNTELLNSEKIGVDREQLKLVKQKLKSDTAAFVSSLRNRQVLINRLNGRYDQLREKYNADGALNNAECAVLDGIAAQIIALENLQSSQFNDIHRLFLSASMKYNMSFSMFNSNGELQRPEYIKQMGDLFNLSLKDIVSDVPNTTEVNMFYDQLDTEKVKIAVNGFNGLLDAVIPF